MKENEEEQKERSCCKGIVFNFPGLNEICYYFHILFVITFVLNYKAMQPFVLVTSNYLKGLVNFHNITVVY